ncbi:hypothetical protein MUK42_12053 [Musa troglodytarum]|uniref:Uncharacterized protein n=1 Tax=Musa troglodytarum TaxID=320322 RepID=A0A9E7GX63_9LILI|nr:hypothetical protein MUK42_12053 [Musa troglodytarum]
MASEASVADQTVTEQIDNTAPEDLKGKDKDEKQTEYHVSDDASNADEPSLSKPDDLKGKDEEEKIETIISDVICNADEASLPKPEDPNQEVEEEKIIVEDSSSVEAPTSGPEENLKQKEEGSVIEEVKEEAVDKSVSEPPVEAEEKEIVVDETDAPNTCELPGEPMEQPAEVLEASVAEDSVDKIKESEHTEIMTAEAKSADESSEVTVVPDSPVVTDDKPVEQPTVCLVQEPAPDANVNLNSDETAERPRDEEPLSDGMEVSPESSKEEVPRNENSPSITEDLTTKVHETIETESSEAIAVVPSVDEPKEAEEETIVAELPSDSGAKESAGEERVSTTSVTEVSDTTPATEVAECAAEPEVDVKKEKEGSTIDVDKTTLGDTIQTIVESEVTGISEEVKIDQMKNESLESEKLTLAEASRDIDLGGAENNKASPNNPECDFKELESSEDKKQETEKVVDQCSAETTKDSGGTKVEEEAPKTDVPSKKSKSQGNNIISKVKKSIVKVKKAIIGKSPSSKAMTPEGDDEMKAK